MKAELGASNFPPEAVLRQNNATETLEKGNLECTPRDSLATMITMTLVRPLDTRQESIRDQNGSSNSNTQYSVLE